MIQFDVINIEFNRPGLTEVNSPVYARVPIFLLSTLPRRNSDVAIARPDFDNKSRSIASRLYARPRRNSKAQFPLFVSRQVNYVRVYAMSIKSLSPDDRVSSGASL